MVIKPGQNQPLRFQHPSIVQVPVENLKLPKRRLRTHNRAQKRKLQSVLRSVGFIDPIVVDEDYNVLAGNLRAEAADEMGLTTVPVIKISHLNDLEKRAYVLAANRLALDAGWDRRLLAIELGELKVLLPDANIEIEATGFSISDFDQVILEGAALSAEADEPALPEPGPPVTRIGDLWICGASRLLCADALAPASFAQLMGGERATMAFTDPPYNVSIRKHARGNARVKQREFAEASGEMTPAQYLEFLKSAFHRIAEVSIDGAIVFACIDWAHLAIMVSAGALSFTELKNICVWVKSNAGMGTFYRSRHEMICAFKVGTASHINTFELGQNGRSRSNVWEYAGLNSFGAGRDDALAVHPTVKPTRMIADAMLDCSRPGSIVVDPFMGSGSTLLAGEMVGRRVFGLEIDPLYVDAAVRRWQAFTGRDALLAATGQTFADVSAERQAILADPITVAQEGSPQS